MRHPPQNNTMFTKFYNNNASAKFKTEFPANCLVLARGYFHPLCFNVHVIHMGAFVTNKRIASMSFPITEIEAPRIFLKGR